jgi:hypothetical protein
MADLREAALLGTSTEVVRKRAARGSLRSERHDGRVVVWVDDGRTEGGREDEVDGGPLVEVLTDQVAYLRSQLDQEKEARRRADTIIAQIAQANAALAARVPELEAPPAELPGGKEAAAAPTYGARAAPERSSWWRRLLGGE